jgi:hypothetical protein
MKKLRGENVIETTLQRLDGLTLDEVRATAAQTLEAIHGLIRHRRIIMDGEKLLTVSFSLAAERSYADGDESAASILDIQNVLGTFQARDSRRQADTMSDRAIESTQEVVSRMNKAERGLFPAPNVHVDDREH